MWMGRNQGRGERKEENSCERKGDERGEGEN